MRQDKRVYSHHFGLFKVQIDCALEICMRRNRITRHRQGVDGWDRVGLDGCPSGGKYRTPYGAYKNLLLWN